MTQHESRKRHWAQDGFEVPRRQIDDQALRFSETHGFEFFRQHLDVPVEPERFRRLDLRKAPLHESTKVIPKDIGVAGEGAVAHGYRPSAQAFMRV